MRATQFAPQLTNSPHLRRFCVAIFFLALIVLGTSIYRDYGFGVDEKIERATGMVSLNYLAHQFGIKSLETNAVLERFEDANLANFIARDYPVLFNLPAAVLELALDIQEEQDIYFLRHWLNWIIVLLGLYAIFCLAERRFSSWRIGLLAAVFFITSPRFFAEAFYNNKDLIFVAFFAIATNSLMQFILQPTRWLALWHGLATALAINVRIMGVIFIVFTLGIILLRGIKGQLAWRLIVVDLVIYLVSATVFTYLFWPWLWANPIGNFLEGFSNMAHFRQEFNLPYLGGSVLSTNLPWHFVPVYIAITTPILYLLLFGVGFINTVVNIIRSRFHLWQTEQQLQDLIFLGLFLGPIIAVIALNSVLYNGWRQIYFIYPAFILLAIKGLLLIWHLTLRNWVYAQKYLRILVVLGLSFSLLSSTWWMIKNHPFQAMYFNFLAGKNWDTNFELDFWALGHRSAQEFIAQQDDRPIVRVAGIWHDILGVPARPRIVRVEDADIADYAVGNQDPATFEKIGAIQVDGRDIAPIWRRKGPLLAIAPVALGEVITFAKGAKGTDYLIAVGRREQTSWGWSYPEPWGVWSEGKRATILLPLPKAKPASLVLNVRAFIDANHPSQVGQIYINDVLSQNFSITQAQSQITIALSEQMRSRNYLMIEFKFKNPVRPKDLGNGDDIRNLALGLMSIEFQ